MSSPTPTAMPAPCPEGLRAARVRYQRCLACGSPQTLRRLACMSCGDERLEWKEASGRGVVHAVTVVSRAPSDAFRALVPYTLVVVTLAEGPRLMGHGTPGLQIGQAVAAGFFAHDGTTLLRFSPAVD